MERTLWIALTLVALALVAAFFFYMPVLPILIAAGILLESLCAGALALTKGWLARWVEIEDEPQHHAGAAIAGASRS